MKRKTTVYERILYHMGNASLMYFAFRVKVKGIFSQDELEEALYKLQQKHPLAGVRVIMTEDKKQYITTENVPRIPLNIFNEKETDWKAVISEELCKSFDIFKGPMIRVFISQNEDISDIVFIFHHAICDGLSAVVFIHDLFSFLANPQQPLNPYMEAPVFTNLIKNDVLDIIKSKEMPDWLKNRKIPELRHAEGEPFPKPDYMIHNWSFAENDAKKIILLAKNKNVSVHSILGTVLLKSFAEEFGPKEGFKRVLQTPVSFMPFLVDKADKYFGLFNGILKVEIDCSPERTIPEIAQDINKKLKDQLDNYDPLIGYYFFNEYGLKGIDDPELFFANNPGQPMDYDFSLSNLGIIQIQKDYGNYEVEEVFGPIFSAIKGEKVISANSHQGRMFFTCIFDKNFSESSACGNIIKRSLDMFQDIFK